MKSDSKTGKATAEKTPLLKTENLSIDFEGIKKIRAVENVNLEIFPGEFAALVGESGCGKTLTAKAIMNVSEPNVKTEGGIFFRTENGFVNLLTLSEKERRKISGKDISMIFQDPAAALDPLAPVGKQIEEAAVVHGMPRKEARAKAELLMKKSGLTDTDRIYKSYPHELSGGQKQRVLISAALINSPRLLIADEPTSALDVTIQKEILETILELNRESGTSLLLITHDFSIVKKICARTFIMYAGRIAESGFTEEVLSNPLHPYTKALVKAVPSNAEKDGRLFTIPGSVPPPSERKENRCRFFDRCPVSHPECAENSPKVFYDPESARFAECSFAKGDAHGK